MQRIDIYSLHVKAHRHIYMSTMFFNNVPYCSNCMSLFVCSLHVVEEIISLADQSQPRGYPSLSVRIRKSYKNREVHVGVRPALQRARMGSDGRSTYWFLCVVM